MARLRTACQRAADGDASPEEDVASATMRSLVLASAAFIETPTGFAFPLPLYSLNPVCADRESQVSIARGG
ncbi:hypothetical protein K426_11405 [Sphingobium sp. TKS]|nr:hypothetical protein K426_11405 [Sphingobium sp. TKS]